MSLRILSAMLLASALIASPAMAQTTPAKPATPAAPAAAPAKPAAPAAKAAADDEDDTPSSAEVKKACDAKWKARPDAATNKGWKAYFTFMAKCM